MGMTMPRSQRETKSTPARPGRRTAQAKQTREAPEEEVVEATTEKATNQTTTRSKATHQADSGEAATHQTAAHQTAAHQAGTKAAAKEATSAKTATQETVSSKETSNKEVKGSRTHKAAAKTDARSEFLEGQKVALIAERSTYLKQADELKAQADSLALEHEPGDVQFDEEGGEGGTSNVDRELDLLLSAQARASITEIDVALAKIENGTYGLCEQCGAVIPEARLEALPHASLCVSCKNGGLSSRR
jgi:DnaK suppressor protein